GIPLSTGIQVTGVGGLGNFYPRIAAHATRAEWMISTAGSFKATLAQRIGTTSLSGAPPLPPPTPVPQAPPGTQVSLNRSVLFLGILAGTNMPSSPPQPVTVKFANGTANWSVSSSVGFLDIVPATGSGNGTFTVALKPGKYS